VAAYRRILSIDIGGTGLKAAIIDAKGNLKGQHRRVPTPHPCPPALLVKTLAALAVPFKRFDCIAIGFPGVVRGSRVVTAPNMGTPLYAGFDLAGRLSKRLGGKPTRLVNDADMQGLAVVKGEGLEFVVTLGTGFGTALFRDGELMPHLEISQMLAHNGRTFDAYLGEKTRKKIGNRRWNRRVARMLPMLHILLNYDRLYIGGGNAKRLTIALPRHAEIVQNIAGLKGGAGLWRQAHW